MRPMKKKPKLEKDYSKDLVDHMKANDWLVIKLHGNKYQKGLPDYVAFHRKYGTRWIEMKKPKDGSPLTPDQKRVFMEMTVKGVSIFILTGKKDYEKLFETANWYQWLDPSLKNRAGEH